MWTRTTTRRTRRITMKIWMLRRPKIYPASPSINPPPPLLPLPRLDPRRADRELSTSSRTILFRGSAQDIPVSGEAKLGSYDTRRTICPGRNVVMVITKLVVGRRLMMGFVIDRGICICICTCLLASETCQQLGWTWLSERVGERARTIQPRGQRWTRLRLRTEFKEQGKAARLGSRSGTGR